MFVFHLVLPFTMSLAFAKISVPDIFNNKTREVKPAEITNYNISYVSLDTVPGAVRQINDSIFWNTYIRALVKTSKEALQNIRNSVKQNYNLDSNLVWLMDELFNDIDDFENNLHETLKKVVESDGYNETKEFMLDFMDITISLINDMVERNLKNIELITPTKWYKTLKVKIQRQEVKAASNYVENIICKIGICRDIRLYTDYLKIWLRYLLKLKPKTLKSFFKDFSASLNKHKHFVKYNVKFRKHIKNLLNSDVQIQKEHLDFLDEILVNKDSDNNLVPKILQKTAYLLTDVFSLIDMNYDVNENNSKKLVQISAQFQQLSEEKIVDISPALNSIFDNLKLNMDIWPLSVQNQIFYMWSEILRL